jgi:hypothetical protein
MVSGSRIPSTAGHQLQPKNLIKKFEYHSAPSSGKRLGSLHPVPDMVPPSWLKGKNHHPKKNYPCPIHTSLFYPTSMAVGQAVFHHLSSHSSSSLQSDSACARAPDSHTRGYPKYRASV